MALQSLGFDALLVEAARLASLQDAERDPMVEADYKALKNRITKYNTNFSLGLDFTNDDCLAQSIQLCRAFSQKWNDECKIPESRQTDMGRKFAFLAPTVPNEEFGIVYAEELVESVLGKGQDGKIADKLREGLMTLADPEYLARLHEKTRHRLTSSDREKELAEAQLNTLQAQNTIGQSLIRFINWGAEQIMGLFTSPPYTSHASKIAKAKENLQEWKSTVARTSTLEEKIAKKRGVEHVSKIRLLAGSSAPVTPKNPGLSATTWRFASIAASFMAVAAVAVGYKFRKPIGELLSRPSNSSAAVSTTVPAAKPKAQAPTNSEKNSVPPTSTSFGQAPGGSYNPTVTTPPAALRSFGSGNSPQTRPTAERGSK